MDKLVDSNLLEAIDKLFELNIGDYVALPQVGCVVFFASFLSISHAWLLVTRKVFFLVTLVLWYFKSNECG